jgi:aryl-alcohol dehydrogenase-like predicted oxidoreductase
LLALAWVLALGDDIVPIPGTTRRDHLDQNPAALDLHLTADDRRRLADAVLPSAVAGPRHPERAMRAAQR